MFSLIFLSISIPFLLDFPKEFFFVFEWGVGYKAIGECKRVFGKLWLRNEPMDQKNEIQVIGKLEPIFPRKCKKMKQG
jgi:hypothetical protein